MGYNVNESAKKNILDAIEKLGDKADFEAKYGVKDKGVLMFAAGDGIILLQPQKPVGKKLKRNFQRKKLKLTLHVLRWLSL